MTKSSLTEGSIRRSIVKLSVPIVLANLLQTAYQLTDTFWVGRLGAEAVAAISMAFPVIFLTISMGSGFCIAGTVLVSQYKGQGNRQMICKTASQTYALIIVISAALSLLGAISAKYIVSMMGGTDDVLLMATEYLGISMLGLVFSFTYIMFQSLFRGIGNVYVPLMVVFISVILNFVIDPLLIHGWGPFPAFGIKGAAYATIGTQAVSAIIGTWYMASKKHDFEISFAQMRPDWRFIGKIFSLGLPASAEQSTRALGMTVMTFLVASFGTVTLAAYGIGVRILSFVIIPALGFSMATSTLVGQNIGASKHSRAAEVAHVANWTAFLVLSTAGILTFFFSEWIVLLFVPGEELVIKEGARFISIISLTFGLIGVQQIVSGALRGGGSTLTAMLIAMVSLWVFRFPVAYILSMHTSLRTDGIWWSFAISNVLAASLSYAILRRGNWLNSVVGEFDPIERQVIDESLAPPS